MVGRATINYHRDDGCTIVTDWSTHRRHTIIGVHYATDTNVVVTIVPLDRAWVAIVGVKRLTVTIATAASKEPVRTRGTVSGDVSAGCCRNRTGSVKLIRLEEVPKLCVDPVCALGTGSKAQLIDLNLTVRTALVATNLEASVGWIL